MATGAFTFPRSSRLLTEAQFRRVFQRGGRASASGLWARMAPNGRAHARLGMAIGVKAAGGAVARNRLRRQVRESFRRNQQRLAGLDIVVSLRSATGGCQADHWRSLAQLWDAVERSHPAGRGPASARGTGRSWNG